MVHNNVDIITRKYSYVIFLETQTLRKRKGRKKRKQEGEGWTMLFSYF